MTHHQDPTPRRNDGSIPARSLRARRARSASAWVAALVVMGSSQAETAPTQAPPSADLPTQHTMSPAVAFENSPGVLGISIRTLRKESIKAYATESLGVAALSLEDLRLSPVEKDGNIWLNLAADLQYKGTAHAVPKTSRRILDGIARVLAENPDTEIQIDNHTDDYGDAGFNLRLSQRRADALKDYMIDRGIAASRITALGQGEDSPLVDSGKRSPTRAQREKNRRTELIIKPLSVLEDAPESEPGSDQAPAEFAEGNPQAPAQEVAR